MSDYIDSEDGRRLLAEDGSPLVFEDSVPAGTPISIQGGLIRRFSETESLYSVFPGGLLPGIPPSEARLPAASIVTIGGRNRFTTGGNGTWIEESHFQVSLWAKSSATCAQAMLDLVRAFNHNALAASPITLQAGKVFNAQVTGSYTLPSPVPFKGSSFVYRTVVRLTATASRTLS